MKKKNNAAFAVFAALLVFLIGGFLYSIGKSSRAVYAVHEGTVCCLSDRPFVSASQKGSADIKTMKVDLDDGSSIVVPILDIPYVKGARILVREVTGKEAIESQYYAVRYLASEDG